jgi:hypothetical protein
VKFEIKSPNELPTAKTVKPKIGSDKLNKMEKNFINEIISVAIVDIQLIDIMKPIIDKMTVVRYTMDDKLFELKFDLMNIDNDNNDNDKSDERRSEWDSKSKNDVMKGDIRHCRSNNEKLSTHIDLRSIDFLKVIEPGIIIVSTTGIVALSIVINGRQIKMKTLFNIELFENPSNEGNKMRSKLTLTSKKFLTLLKIGVFNWSTCPSYPKTGVPGSVMSSSSNSGSSLYLSSSSWYNAAGAECEDVLDS